MSIFKNSNGGKSAILDLNEFQRAEAPHYGQLEEKWEVEVDASGRRQRTLILPGQTLLKVLTGQTTFDERCDPGTGLRAHNIRYSGSKFEDIIPDVYGNAFFIEGRVVFGVRTFATDYGPLSMPYLLTGDEVQFSYR